MVNFFCWLYFSFTFSILSTSGGQSHFWALLTCILSSIVPWNGLRHLLGFSRGFFFTTLQTCLLTSGNILGGVYQPPPWLYTLFLYLYVFGRKKVSPGPLYISTLRGIWLGMHTKMSLSWVMFQRTAPSWMDKKKTAVRLGCGTSDRDNPCCFVRIIAVVTSWCPAYALNLPPGSASVVQYGRPPFFWVAKLIS